MILFLAAGLSYGQSAAMKHLNKGVDYAAQGKFKDAKEEFGKVSKADPLYTSIEEDLKIIEDVIDKKIESKVAIHLFRGAAYVLKGKYDEGIEEYNKAIEINPNLAMAYRFRGFAYARKRQYDKAITDYNKALEINPRLASAYERRGNAYADKDLYDKAIADYNKAIEITPTYVSAYNNRGIAYYHTGLYDHAISDFSKALEINPSYAKAYANRGFAYRSKGEYEKAMEDFRKAEGLGYQVNPGFYITLRQALRKIRKTDFPLETLVPVLLVGVAILLIFILIAKITTSYDVKRRETLETTAREMGLEYGEAAFIDKVCYEAGFPLFSKAGQVTNCMYGKYEDVGVAVFNYSYQVVQGEHRTTYRHTVVLFSSEVSLFPDFAIFPITKFPGWKTFFLDSLSIDSKIHEDFAKNYFVRGTDEIQIRHLLTVDVLDYFSEHPLLFVEVRGNQLIVYVESVADFRWFLDKAKTIYELFRKSESN